MNFLTPNSGSHIQPCSFTSEVCVTKFLAVISIVLHLTQAVFNITTSFDTVWFLDTVNQCFGNLFTWRAHIRCLHLAGGFQNITICSYASCRPAGIWVDGCKFYCSPNLQSLRCLSDTIIIEWQYMIPSSHSWMIGSKSWHVLFGLFLFDVNRLTLEPVFLSTLAPPQQLSICFIIDNP